MSRKSISIACHYLQIGDTQAIYPLLTVMGDGKAYKLDRFTHEQEKTVFLNGRLLLSHVAHPIVGQAPRIISIEEMKVMVETHHDWILTLPNGEVFRSVEQLRTLS